MVLVFQFFSKSSTFLCFQSKSWLYFQQCSAVWLFLLADLMAVMCSSALIFKKKHYDSRHDKLRNNMDTTESTNTNIFKIIKEQYGASTLSQCRKLEKTELKYARYTNHLRCSLRCLHNNLIPNDLYLKPKLQDQKSRKILDKASRLLLQNRIHENHNIRKDLQSSIKQTTDNLSDTLTQEQA